jgi:DNA polymerase-3 subunit gamma/tau
MALDQLVSLGQGRVTLDNALRLLGLVESETFEKVVAFALHRDTAGLLGIVAELAKRGRDIERFVKNLMAYIRDLLLLRGGADPKTTGLDGARYERARMRFMDQPIEPLLNLMQALVDLEPRLKGTVPARFLLEFAFIKLTALEPVDGLARLIGRLEALEKKY